MEGYCSTGQSPQRVVVPMEADEEEKEEEEEEEDNISTGQETGPGFMDFSKAKQNIYVRPI
jgi:hypothetical protein